MTIKIAHEAPLSIFDEVQELTDYDYALVHLFDESEEYYSKFATALAKGRKVILDNSIFELGEAFDADKYADYICSLLPTEYIVPDVLNDYKGTVNSFKAFKEKYPDLPGKTIGVVQANNYDHIVDCYRFMQANADKVAFSFDYSFFEREDRGSDTLQAWMFGRIRMINRLLSDGIIDTTKPHHLLGCSLPQEFKAYRDLRWIDTIDTSNPVTAGMEGVYYSSNGLNDKPKAKLFTKMYDKVNTRNRELIRFNIKKFREFACFA